MRVAFELVDDGEERFRADPKLVLGLSQCCLGSVAWRRARFSPAAVDGLGADMLVIC